MVILPQLVWHLCRCAVRSFALGIETETSPAPSFFLKQLAGTFISPALTFENISCHPRFFAPFLTTLTLLAGFWGVVYLRLGWSGMAVAAVQYFRRGTLVTQDEIDFALYFSRAAGLAISMGGASAVLVHLLIFSWAGSRLANLFFNVGLRLRVAMSLACWAYLAKTIAQIIFGIPMVLFGGVDGLNFGNLLPTNIAFFLDPKDTSRIIYALLQSLDLIQLWYFALLGIAFARHSDDPASPRLLAVSLAVLWIVWNVFFAVFRDVILGS
jgi:hypothetical protein